MILIHGNQTTCDPFVYLLLTFIFSRATGLKEELMEGTGVILELTLRAEQNLKNQNSSFKQCFKLYTI